MRTLLALALLPALAPQLAIPLAAQGAGGPGAGDPVAVFTEHPRLFLRPARLRMLKRERQRESERWRQFAAVETGGAALPEPGLAGALYYQITGDAAAGKAAVAWALAAGSDTRQMALVFDWCQDAMSDAQKTELAARLARSIAQPPADDSLAAARARALTAIALYDDVPGIPQRELNRLARVWWPGIAASLAAGKDVLPPRDTLALVELLHAIRDNTNLDLRESSPRFFRDLPIERLMSYYPAPFPDRENEYRIGAGVVAGAPGFRQAALDRAADLAMVALDSNAQETQFLQGWLMHDPFMLRGVLGAPYEFLWANPYQPGLTFYHLPLAFHDATLGRLFVRSSWDESAAWLGYFGGKAWKFEGGRLAELDPLAGAPLQLDSAAIFPGEAARAFRFTPREGQAVFLIGLEPRRNYRVEVTGEKTREAETDPGGILQLELTPGRQAGVKVREAP